MAFNKFFSGLKKTREVFAKHFLGIGLVDPNGSLNEATLESLEEALILADVGLPAASKIIEELKKNPPREEPQKALAQIISQRFASIPISTNIPRNKPHIILIVGVNGSGKTTTIAKLAQRTIQDGGKVIMAAADTFRAAAGEQLEIWAKRVGAELVRQASGSDPAAVAYDAIKAAQARNIDMVLIDTAGRLQTKTNLMEELKKIRRVIGKAMDGAPHETLLVMDATIGQNGLSQIDLFNAATALTGIVMTKLDGTAKGGVLVAASEKYGIPIKYVGLGEKPDDLIDFDPLAFSEALVGIDEQS